jgi:hypothetical protein
MTDILMPRETTYPGRLMLYIFSITYKATLLKLPASGTATSGLPARILASPLQPMSNASTTKNQKQMTLSSLYAK